MKVIAFLLCIASLIAGFLGAMWLIGSEIQGHFHVLENVSTGFGSSVGAGIIFCLFGLIAACVLGMIFIVLSVAYLYFEEVFG